MNVLIVGLGRTGAYLSQQLAQSGAHRVIAVEAREEQAHLVTEGTRVIWADGCDPLVLENAGVRNSDLVVATTGDDEDNLVIAQLAKTHFGVPRLIARVNNPRNSWLYTRDWGVDVAVSPTDIITKIIQEEMSLGDLITLLKLRGGEVALVEITIAGDSSACGKSVSELRLPPGTVIVTVLRGGELIIPGGGTRLEGGDELLAVTSVNTEQGLVRALK